jgi:hypothetical protein
MRQSVEKVEHILRQQGYIWLSPIASELFKKSYKVVVNWAIECMKIYISEAKVDDPSKINNYIQQLLNLQTDSHNIFTSDLCKKISMEIWDSSSREEIQVAISRLWWSIAAFKDGDDKRGISEASMAVELLLPDNISDRQLLNRYLGTALLIDEKSCRVGRCPRTTFSEAITSD